MVTFSIQVDKSLQISQKVEEIVSAFVSQQQLVQSNVPRGFAGRIDASNIGIITSISYLQFICIF